jgi:hypothetical protein
VQSSPIDQRNHHRALRTLLLVCAVAALPAHAKNAPDAGMGAQLAVQINADKLTLAAAGAPQVYLYGNLDAGAPQRIEALIRSWKIPRGSDVYLQSASGDINAGIALGRLFRTYSIVTHLGTPRRNARTRMLPKDAQCVDACAYAYFGGVYRWAPTGRDRLGVHLPSAAQRPMIDAYLKDMGVREEALMPSTPSASSDPAWLDPDQMLASGLANNGRLPLNATYQQVDGAPFLSLNQIVRNGVNRVTIACKPDHLVLTAYYIVGGDRARKVVAGAGRSFFEIDGREALPAQAANVTTLNEAIVTTRDYPKAQLGRILNGRSMGAWLTDRHKSVRYGFVIFLAAVRGQLGAFGSACR